MVRNRKDNRTLDLLSWTPPEVAVSYKKEQVRAHTLNGKFARAISLAMSECELSTKEIVESMSSYLGEKITESMLYTYSSQAREKNRINMPRFAALIHATEDYRLLSLLPELFGFAVVADKYQDIIELHLIAEHKKQVAAREVVLEARQKAAR